MKKNNFFIPANFLVQKSLQVGAFIVLCVGHTIATETKVVTFGGGIPKLDRPIIAMASGAGHTVVLKEDSTLTGWGDNTYGQLSFPESAKKVSQIAAGSHSTLIMYADSSIQTIGKKANDFSVTQASLVAGGTHNIYAVIDTNNTHWIISPDTILQVNQKVKALAVGENHTLVLFEDGSLQGWGKNNFGQIDIPSDLPKVTAVAAGSNFSIILLDNGKLMAWGDSLYGKTKLPENLTDTKAIAAGDNHVVALRQNGTVLVWGNISKNKIHFEGLENIKAISAQGYGSLFLRENGSIYDWGRNQLLGQESNLISIAAGDYHLVALKNDGSLVTGGNPFPMPEKFTDISSIAAGGSHSLALKKDGSVIAWGDATYGQTILHGRKGMKSLIAGRAFSAGLKDDGTIVVEGTGPVTSVPVEYQKAKFKLIVAGDDHIVAIKESGEVVSWGDTSYGKTQVPTDLGNVIDVAAGYGHSIALKEDGTLVAWGTNAEGQIRIPENLSNVVSIEAKFGHNVALTKVGQVVAWGRNSEGQTEINGLRNVKAIAAGRNFSAAIIEKSVVTQNTATQIPFAKKDLHGVMLQGSILTLPENTYAHLLNTKGQILQRIESGTGIYNLRNLNSAQGIVFLRVFDHKHNLMMNKLIY